VEEKNGPALLVLSGGQKGAYSGGGVCALTELGLVDAFKTAVGVSTGAPGICYFLAGQARVGTSFYYEENTDGGFIDYVRAFGGGSIMSIDFISKNFNNGPKKLDLVRLLENKTDAYIAVTNLDKEQGELVNVREVGGVVDLIRASCSVPVVNGGEVYLDKQQDTSKYIDGFVGMSFPAKEVVEKFNPSSLLVFVNSSKSVRSGFWGKLLYRYIGVLFNYDNSRSKLEKRLNNLDKIFFEEMHFLRKSGIPYLVIWTDDEISALAQDSKKIKAAADRFEKYVYTLGSKFF
jgi:predicted patatin/cPLA2 family phospholipase